MPGGVSREVLCHRPQKGDILPTLGVPSFPAHLWLLLEHQLSDGEVLTLGRLLRGKFLGKWPP